MNNDVEELWQWIKSGQPMSIAEAGVNHLGSLELAEKLIAGTKEAGATAIKFQSYKAKNLCTRDAPRFWDWDGEEDPNGTQYDSYSLLDSFGEEEHRELKRMCDSYNIEFMSTPFDNEATDYLDRIGIRAYKIASCDITNHPLLAHVAKKNKIVMLSTGAASLNEIEAAVEVVSNHTEKIVVMHCNLKYPTANSEINLAMINQLVERFGDRCVIGLSDHTMDLHTPAFAYMLGATVFERHFTIDKTLGKSADHWLSADVPELRQIIAKQKIAATMFGQSKKECTESEERAKKYARRSIVASRDIRAGESFSLDNMTCKRPGTGISPIEMESVIGKIAIMNIAEDELLNYQHYKEQK